MTVDTWTMYAAWDERNGGYWKHVGSAPQFTCMHGTPAEDVHLVTATVDPAGEYFAWQNLHELDKPPIMIYRFEGMFRMCFPYGVEAEVKASRGRDLKLRIEATE